MSGRKSTATKPRAKGLPPAGTRSGRGAASLMPYLESQRASGPKAAQAGEPAPPKRRRGK